MAYKRPQRKSLKEETKRKRPVDSVPPATAGFLSGVLPVPETKDTKDSKTELVIVERPPFKFDPKVGGEKPHSCVGDFAPLSGKSLMAMVGYRTPHRFRLTRSGTLVSGGAGQYSINLGIYPALYDQNGALSGLFDLAKIVAVRLHLKPLQNFPVYTSGGAATLAGSNIAVAFDQGGFAASSSYTYGQSLRLPGADIVSLNSTKSNELVTRWYKLPKSRPWAGWSYVPILGDPFPANAGTFTINTETALSNGVTYQGYFMEAVVDVKAQF